jgi:glycerate dehydrogenase
MLMTTKGMRIVVLDGLTLNPGDLSWAELQGLGQCHIYDRSAQDEVVRRAEGAEIVLTNKTVVRREHILPLSALRYIGVLATGYNVVDVAAAKERGVPVTNVPAYGTRSVAQHTLALLLELALHVGHHAETVRQGRWTASPDFCYWDFPLVELDALTLGVVGFGQIGQAVAQLARAFGMRVIAYSRTRRGAMPDGIEFVDLETLFRKSDAVTLHCPLTPENRGLVNKERLALMKPSAFLLNTSRGPLVDESALAAALNQGRLAGAAVDVLTTEPPPAENPLFAAKNCLVTPHIAWATRAARSRLLNAAVANVKAFLAGKPQNVVN